MLALHMAHFLISYFLFNPVARPLFNKEAFAEQMVVGQVKRVIWLLKTYPARPFSDDASSKQSSSCADQIFGHDGSTGVLGTGGVNVNCLLEGGGHGGREGGREGGRGEFRTGSKFCRMVKW